jgi:hypothetical protein
MTQHVNDISLRSVMGPTGAGRSSVSLRLDQDDGRVMLNYLSSLKRPRALPMALDTTWNLAQLRFLLQK